MLSIRQFRTGLCLGAMLLAAACDSALEIETIAPRRAAIRESFVEPGRTRLANTYPIAMPVSARIARIDLEPGDAVRKGQPLAALDLVPLEQAVAAARAVIGALEAQIAVKDDNRLERSMVEGLNIEIEAMDATLQAAQESIAAEKARLGHAERNRDRSEQLHKNGSISQSDLDDAHLIAATALTDLRQEEFVYAAVVAMRAAMMIGPRAVEEYISRETLERRGLEERISEARAELVRAEHDLELAQLLSPIDGIVLERYEQGDTVLPAGQPLLLIGNLDEIEAVADVLTQDAMRLAPGTEVILEPTSGMPEIPGHVKRIEPAGFTKLSSLGVEQQRTNAIVAFENPPEGLGVGYRVRARFFTGTNANALVVPRFSVLQAPDGSFFVFAVEDGTLQKRTVRLGLRNDTELEILDGLTEKDRIASEPSTKMEAGTRVKAAAAGTQP